MVFNLFMIIVELCTNQHLDIGKYEMYQFKNFKLSKKGFIWWNIYHLLLAKISNKKRKEIQQETDIKIS